MTLRRLASPPIVLLAALALAVATLAAGPSEERPAPPRSRPSPPTAGEKAEEHFKNIQALKGYPADEIIPAMQFISASLGVDCEFCHVEHAPEKDDKKEKKTARKMITMTLAIDHDSFEGRREVTCNSCHRGAAHPLSVPAISEGPVEAEAPAPATPELPGAEAIVERYVAAVGGADALAKITSRVEKGNLSFGDRSFPVEVYAKAPDKRLSIVHTPRGESITAYDGRAGWRAGSGRPPRAMSSPETEAAAVDADLRFPADLGQRYAKLRVAPGESIDGRSTVQVTARNGDRPPVELWFDTGSGLLARVVTYVETPLGRNPTQIDYGDYRDVDGVRLPFRWTVARPGSRFTIQMDEVVQNEPLEDARFEKPSGS